MSACATLGRALRSTGENAISLDEKLRLAVALVGAEEQCVFPDRFRFVFDWLCGVLRNAKAGSTDIPPRADVRFWRLLDALLQRAAGGTESIADDAPPTRLPAALPASLRSRFSQSSRLMLQSAMTALEHGDLEDAEAASLYARVRRVARLLLVEESGWFHPGRTTRT